MPSAPQSGPAAGEQEACINWLKAQTALIRPKIIVCLGRIAACRLITPDFKVTRQHGEFFLKNGVWMMGTLHPAALLRTQPEAGRVAVSWRCGTKSERSVIPPSCITRNSPNHTPLRNGRKGRASP